MYSRILEENLQKYKAFPGIVIMGPRQAGKTTLARLAFPNHSYFTFDNAFFRSMATDDPERFLQTYENEYGLIIDEFQYVPTLLPYIKMAIDFKKRPGYFVLTGSQNFLANSAISETLAGRVSILNLFPFSIAELSQNNLLENTDDLILHGGYPRIYDEKLSPSDLYLAYIQTYVERDVRQLINIGNVAIFQRFIALCAGRIGQELNLSALSDETGVTLATVKSWLSVLEASYVLFLLPPYFKNFNKRIIKRSKLYFFDTGLACTLLRIFSSDVLAVSPFRGPLFENLIIADLYKQYSNQGLRPSLYFWRDSKGAYEIDCVIDEGSSMFPIEIKSSQTFSTDFFRGINNWNKLSGGSPEQSYLVYGGGESLLRREGNIVGWQDAGQLVNKIKNHINT